MRSKGAQCKSIGRGEGSEIAESSSLDSGICGAETDLEGLFSSGCDDLRISAVRQIFPWLLCDSSERSERAREIVFSCFRPFVLS